MKRALLLVPRRDLDAVVEAVAALGVLHLLDLAEREEWCWAVRAYDVAEQRRAYEEILQRVESLVRSLRPIAPAGPSGALPEPGELEAQVAEWSAELERIRGARSRLREEVEALRRNAEGLAALAPTGVAPGRLERLRFLHAACGWVAADDLARLDESLAHVFHRLVPAGRRGDERLVFAFVGRHDAPVLDRALEGVGCEPLVLPPATAESAAGHEVHERLAQAEAELAGLDAEFERLRTELALPLARAREAATRELALIAGRAFAGRSESVVFLAGWLPEDRAEAVRAAVGRATGGCFHLRLDDPLSFDSVRSGAEPVPILFRNPAWIRPFEALTAAYGPPRWREIDPTPIVALAFWVMFGLMFGDVGHGAVLGLAGLWIFRRRVRYRDFGVILMECGLASMLFGVAFGSVFGVEGWIPAMWFHPMDDVSRLLRIGVGFGLAVVSLSFALGVVNAALRRDWSGALLGSQGLLPAFAYWAAAALAMRWLVTGDLGVGLGLATAAVGFPLAAFWLRSIASELRPSDASGPQGAGAAVLTGAVELVDFVVRGVANTVSFVRLGAFAVSHAGLLLAVFALAEQLSGSHLGTIWGVLVIVAGNALVIALEGLIVSIQSVRLVYYELFSHFHGGAGLPYRPLQLRAQAAGEDLS